MMKFLLRPVRLMLLIAAVALPSISSHAQDGTEAVAARTPESAQRFLREQGPFSWEFVVDTTPFSSKSGVERWNTNIERGDNDCVTRFSFVSRAELPNPLQDFALNWGEVLSTGVADNPGKPSRIVLGLKRPLALTTNSPLDPWFKSEGMLHVAMFSVAGNIQGLKRRCAI